MCEQPPGPKSVAVNKLINVSLDVSKQITYMLAMAVFFVLAEFSLVRGMQKKVKTGVHSVKKLQFLFFIIHPLPV